jgi:hypothetical protein
MFGVVAPEIRELLSRLGFPPPVRVRLYFRSPSSFRRRACLLPCSVGTQRADIYETGITPTLQRTSAR